MKRRTSRLCRPVLLLFLVSAACNRSDNSEKLAETAKPKHPSIKTGATVPLSPSANRVLAAMHELETRKDVTCWTSFGQLESFVSTREYSASARLTKTEAVKALVRAIWTEASAASKGMPIEVAQLRLVTPLPASTATNTATNAAPASVELSAPGKLKWDTALKDYKTTVEHWRILLALIEQEIYQPTGLAPLTVAAEKAIASHIGGLSVELLQSSAKLAAKDHSRLVQARHVRAAYSGMLDRHRLRGIKLSLAQRGPPAAGAAKIELERITRSLIDGKIDALVKYNGTGTELHAALDRVRQVPLTDDGLTELLARLSDFAGSVVSGEEPIRLDTFLMTHADKTRAEPHAGIIDGVFVSNAIAQLFPHEGLANGDVRVRFGPHPGKGAKASAHVEPYTVELRLYDMDAVRDASVHWIVLAELWKKTPFALDPFALEYLSEAISVLCTLYLHQAGEIAAERRLESINAYILERTRKSREVIIPPPPVVDDEWTDARAKTKTAIMASLGSALFKDTTEQSGLAVDVTDSRRFDDPRLLVGAGIAVGDVNNDGYPDLFVAGEQLSRLYVNGGKSAPGRFADATVAYGIPTAMDDARGVLFWDMDGDGDDDLLVLRTRPGSLVLRNDGKRFVDVTSDVGLATKPGAHAPLFFDYDGDGDLDLYIGYYGAAGGGRELRPSLDGRNGPANELWRWQDGRFEEVAAKAGVADEGWALALAAWDYDSDGDEDLYVANDFGANVFLRNDGSGHFTDITDETQTGDRGSAMGVSLTDVNGDGRLDFYVTNVDMFSKTIKVIFPNDRSVVDLSQSVLQSFQHLAGNKLYMRTPDTVRPFAERERQSFEPGDRGWGWGAAFFDYDNDGDDDFYLTNGWVAASPAADQNNQLMIAEDGFYYLAPGNSPEAFAGNSRSVVAADFDRDGDVDLLVNSFRASPRLFANLSDETARRRNSWLVLELQGSSPNTHAIGAVVRVRFRVGKSTRTITRKISGGSSYLAQDDAQLHIGLGRAARADVEVTWPNGTVKHYPALRARRRHTLKP